MKTALRLSCFLIFLLGSALNENAHCEEILIGVSTALSGNMSPFGEDTRHALILANDLYGGGKYKLVFEDDQCNNRQAVTIAHKFIDLQNIKYVLGHACNGTLLASIPVYKRAGTLVLSSLATTGDFRDVGEKSFRLFPPDQIGAVRLFVFAEPRYKKVAFFSSEDDYTELMERWFKKTAHDKKSPLQITGETLKIGESDFRPALTRIKQWGPELLVLNVNGEADFTLAVKQAREIGIKAALSGFYMPASDLVLKNLGSAMEGMEFVNLPLLENSLTAEGAKVYAEFVKRYGKPQSIQLGVALTIDSFRLLDRALSSGQAPDAYLREHTHESLIGPITFDASGEVRGIPFQIQKIVNGKVVVQEAQ